jgi:uncharacterized protein with PIN domain
MIVNTSAIMALLLDKPGAPAVAALLARDGAKTPTATY